jgi:hypothetical protein
LRNPILAKNCEFATVDVAIGFPPFNKLRVGILEKSIHPTARTAAILFVPIIGRTEIAVLVKIIFGVLIVLLPVDMEFLSCAAALPSVISILESIDRL